MTALKERNRFEAEFARIDASNDPFVSAVRATRMPMLITDPSIPDNPIVFVNDAFCRLTGYGHDEIVGRNCRFLQGPDTDAADVAKVGAAIARRVPIEIELLSYKKNGERFWNRLLVSPVFDRDGDLTYFFASQFDVTLERERLVRLRRTATPWSMRSRAVPRTWCGARNGYASSSRPGGWARSPSTSPMCISPSPTPAR